MPVLGLAVFLGICWAVGRGIDQAVDRLAGINQAHKTAWRKQHPKAVPAARWAGLVAAVIHGTPAIVRAFRRDWREHYGRKRDDIRARYGRPVPPPAQAPRPQPQPTPRPQATEPDPAPARPQLRLVHTSTNQEGNAMSLTTVREITGTPTLRAELEDQIAIAQAESDDAAANVARAQQRLTRATNTGEAAGRILDRHPSLVGTIGGLIEPAQQKLDAAKAAQYASDHELGQLQAALAELDSHRAMEEAVQATPQASTDTSVYQE